MTAGIIMAPSIAYMDRAYRDAVDFGWSREPIIEMLIPPRWMIRWRRLASMWPACSASTSHRHWREVGTGMIIATKWLT